jgi:TRAP transporter TAXI family solute receptor
MTIRIGTSERAGTFNSQGLALKTIFERHKLINPVDVLESNSASIENANRLHAGEIEFGFMASNWIGRARNGEPPFAQPIDIRMVAPMNAGPMFFIVRSGSDIFSVPGLRGKRVAIGMETSGMVQHAHNIFGVLGIRFTDFTPVYLDFAAGAEALARAEVDAQFQCPIPNKVMTDLAVRVDLRVLPYGVGDLDALIKAVPYYRSMIMRKGAIRGLNIDMPQLAVVNILATHARMPEPVVRDAAAAILAGAEELGRLNHLFVGLSDLFAPLRQKGPSALEFGGVQLHAGALRAYREAGLIGAGA